MGICHTMNESFGVVLQGGLVQGLGAGISFFLQAVETMLKNRTATRPVKHKNLCFIIIVCFVIVEIVIVLFLFSFKKITYTAIVNQF